jgi:hypothetical protein
MASILPALYENFLSDFFHSPTPMESKASCSDCSMLASHALSEPALPSFSQATKCCTFHPDLMNYLVGGLLVDKNPSFADGRQRVRDKIANRVFVGPLGVGASWQTAVKNGQAADFRFGQTRTRQCPYYQTKEGLCSIWQYRDAVCSTWFCKYQTGEDGRLFWSALQDYLEDVENILSRYLVSQIAPDLLDFALEQWQRRLTVSSDQPATTCDPAIYKQIWQSWQGREEELYISCYELASGLSRADVDRLLGALGRSCLETVKERYQILRDPVIGEYLQLNSELELLKKTEEGVLVRTYTEFDSLFIEMNVFKALEEFKPGLKRSFVEQQIELKHQLSLANDQLLKFCQLRVLVKANEIN